MRIQTTYKSIWSVAYPMIIGSLANNLINVVDTAFVGRLGAVSMGASAIGGTFYLIFSLLCIGLASGAQIIIARRNGEKNLTSIGPVFYQNGYMMATFGVLLYIILQFLSPFILRSIISSTDIYNQTIAFTSYRSWGILFVALNAVYTSFFVGMSRTKVLSYSTIIMTVTNIILDYGLIFGNLNLPKMGISGAALASSIAELTAFIFVVIYTQINVKTDELGLYKFKRWSNKIILKNAGLGYPTMFQYLISLGSWFMFFIIIEKLGPQTLAVANILRSLLLLFMMPVWGLSSTANTFTSNLLGQQKSSLMSLLIKRIMTIAILLVLIFAPFVFFFPHWLAQIYSDDPFLISEASKTIWIVYLTMISFIPGVILNNSLSGTGDTKSAFIIEVFGTFVYLTYTYFVALVFHLPSTYIWAAEMVYWLMIGVLSYIRLRSLKWKKILV
jgi:putative MATE family efflux protein